MLVYPANLCRLTSWNEAFIKSPLWLHKLLIRWSHLSMEVKSGPQLHQQQGKRDRVESWVGMDGDELGVHSGEASSETQKRESAPHSNQITSCTTAHSDCGFEGQTRSQHPPAQMRPEGSHASQEVSSVGPLQAQRNGCLEGGG